MSRIQTLDVSQNKITGRLPEQDVTLQDDGSTYCSHWQ